MAAPAATELAQTHTLAPGLCGPRTVPDIAVEERDGTFIGKGKVIRMNKKNRFRARSKSGPAVVFCVRCGSSKIDQPALDRWQTSSGRAAATTATATAAKAAAAKAQPSQSRRSRHN